MTAEHKATIVWRRGDQPFLDKKYSRAHEWRLDGGLVVPASSMPSQLIPPPMSRLDAVDPEEALVGALSSCHMLFFLAFAAKKGFRVDSYDDDAVGILGKNERGKTFVAKVTLRPRVVFSGDKKPAAAEVDELHHLAHAECYIANSIRSEVVVEPPPAVLV